jgi:hypothetical protein
MVWPSYTFLAFSLRIFSRVVEATKNPIYPQPTKDRLVFVGLFGLFHPYEKKFAPQ